MSLRQDNIDEDKWFCTFCMKWKPSYLFFSRKECLACRIKRYNERENRE